MTQPPSAAPTPGPQPQPQPQPGGGPSSGPGGQGGFGPGGGPAGQGGFGPGGGPAGQGGFGPGGGPAGQGGFGPAGPGGFAPHGPQGPFPDFAPGPHPNFQPPHQQVGPPQQSGPQGPYPAAGWPGDDSASRRPQVPRTVALAGALQVAALVLIPLGAALPFGDAFADEALWATSTTWSVFALVAAVVQLAPWAARTQQRPADAAWRVGAVGVAALVVFWVLIVLPGISANSNFVLTMGTFAAALGLWLSPGRQL